MPINILSGASYLLFYRGAFYPMHMGDNIIVGENSIINAQSIGSYVHIGKNCIIVSHAYLKVGGAGYFIMYCSLAPVC